MINADITIYNNIFETQNTVACISLDCYQISMGKSQFKVEQYYSNDILLKIGHTNKDILTIGSFDKSSVTFLIFSSNGQCQSTLNSNPVSGNTFVCIDSDTKLSYFQPENSSFIYLSISKQKLKSLGLEYTFLLDTYIYHADTICYELKSLVNRLRSLTKQQLLEMNENLLYGRFLKILLKASRELNKLNQLNAIGRHHTIVLKIYNYILLNASEKIVLQDLSEAIDEGIRTMQRAFKSTCHITIKQFIKIYRLHQVRKELLYSFQHETITDIALRHGFIHFGRFSHEYKIFFGELPSKTNYINR